MPEPGLAEFQRDLDRALKGDAAALKGWWTDAECGTAALAVYRNTILSGAAEALAANYPTVERVAGAAWFRAAALSFVKAEPPGRPALFDYGEGFPAWLEPEGEAAGLGYLPDLARIDRLWTEALFAPEAPALSAADFTGELADLTAEPHPSLRVARFGWNAPALWRLNQGGGTPESMTIDPTPAEVMLLRPREAVAMRTLEPGGLAFLQACAAGRTLGQAAAAATAAGGDVALLFAGLIEAGAFTRLRRPTRGPA